MKEKIQYFTEFASIKPDATSFYNRAEIHGRKNPEIQKPVTKKCIDNRKFVRLKTALNYLVITSKNQRVYCKRLKKEFRFKINFITLTLSDCQAHDDKFIKKYMLDPFLKFILYRGATGYVWKAERQKNGNLHFHITTNKYIHYMDIRNKWNHLQWKYGYLKKRLDGGGDLSPNSTDVKAVISVDKAMKYMFKYILKKEAGKEPIEGHNYGYSRNYAQVKLVMETLTQDFTEVYTYLQTLKHHKVKYDYVTTMYHELIDLAKCPINLKRMIVEATSREICNNRPQLPLS